MQPEVYYFLIFKYYFTNIAHSFQENKTWFPLRNSQSAIGVKDKKTPEWKHRTDLEIQKNSREDTDW